MSFVLIRSFRKTSISILYSLIIVAPLTSPVECALVDPGSRELRCPLETDMGPLRGLLHPENPMEGPSYGREGQYRESRHTLFITWTRESTKSSRAQGA